MRVGVLAVMLAAALAAVHPASAQSPQQTLASLIGSFANADATQTYLPGSNGYVAQGISDKMFQALASMLGGQAPALHYVDQIAGGQFHGEAHPDTNTVDLDGTALQALVNTLDHNHSGAVNGLPHEMAHLRQTAPVLADALLREGGAQAFADTQTPMAARAAHQPYDQTRNYDGVYAPLVPQVMARGQSWITAGQFGR